MASIMGNGGNCGQRSAAAAGDTVQVDMQQQQQQQQQSTNAPAATATAAQGAAAALPPAPVPPPPPPTLPSVPPPDYFATYVEEAPPPTYQVAAELPTYEEAERTKDGYAVGGDPDGSPGSPGQHSSVSGITLLTLPGSEYDSSSSSPSSPGDTTLLGNDFVFFTAFVTAFLFNWIGFLLLMCFCHTIAARYGALSGFGLSLTKWTLIVKRSTDLTNAFAMRHGGGGHHHHPHSDDMNGGAGSIFGDGGGSGGGGGPGGAGGVDGNSWLWWLIMAFGLLICVRAIVQYLHIKRAWGGLSTAARERLFFFY